MSFDISKTETFVPLLWIFSKTVLIIFLFNVISTHSVSESVQARAVVSGESVGNIENTAALISPGAEIKSGCVVWVANVPLFERAVFMLILQLVVIERKMDLHIIKSSDVGQKIAQKTLVGLNLHVMTDAFFSFCVYFFVQKYPRIECRHDYMFMLCYLLWFGFGLGFFCAEIQNQKPRSSNDLVTAWSHQGNRTLALQQNLVYVIGIFLMTVTVSAPCLSMIFSDMTRAEYYLRIVLYAFYVCCRCYTQGITVARFFVHDMPNIILFGWILLVPRTLLYLSFVVLCAVYMRLFSLVGAATFCQETASLIDRSSPSSDPSYIANNAGSSVYAHTANRHMHPSNQLIQSAQTTHVPSLTQVAQAAQLSQTQPQQQYQQHGQYYDAQGTASRFTQSQSQSNTALTTSDLMSKLQDMEQNIQTASVKALKSTKRRQQAALF